MRKKHGKIHAVEELRKKLLTKELTIEVTDFGAGSRVSKSPQKQIKSIAKNAATPSKFSAFLAACIEYFGFETVLELGTSLGLNTLYLSQNNHVAVTSFEGDPALCQIAQSHFNELKRTNIKMIAGNIDKTLPEFLSQSGKIDLAYLDANHSYEPTVRYFEMLLPKMSEKSLMVIDDIHWSKEMWQAWKAIKKHPSTVLSLDLFEAGLIFLNPAIQKGEYTLKF